MTSRTALTPTESAALPGVPDRDFAVAVEYARAEKAAATRKAYASDFNLFRAWCSERNVTSLPATPESVAAFLAAQAVAGIKPSTLGRRVAAIRYAHKLAGHESPTDSEAVKATVRGIRRTTGAVKTCKAPVTADKMRAMAAEASNELIGLRDRALLLLGFAGAFRRSELVALNLSDLTECEGGMRVKIARSKTDQEGQGITIGVAPGTVACPVKAVKTWSASCCY
jgi:site-specific recombinase XerD